MRRKTTLKVAPTVTATESMVQSIESEDTTLEPPLQEAAAEDSDTTTPTSPKPRASRRKTRRPVLSDTIPAIPVASFHRLAREMAEDCKSDLRWENAALQALQVAAEAFMVEKFQKAKHTSSLFARKTVGAELLRA